MINMTIYGMLATKRDNGGRQYPSEEMTSLTEKEAGLCRCIEKNNAQGVREMIGFNVDVNFDCPEDVESLGNHGIRYAFHYYPRSYNHTNPICLATAKSSLKIVALLLDAGAQLNGRFPPLVDAARTGHLDMVNLLRMRGANLDHADPHGNVPLYVALLNDHVEIARRLIELGASKNLCLIHACANYQTPQGTNADVVRWLIRNGADINCKLKRPDNDKDDTLSIADYYCTEDDFNEKHHLGLRSILMDEESWSGWTKARARKIITWCTQGKKQQRKINQ